MLPMILGVVVQYVDCNQRIFYVSELVSDNKDSVTSGEDDDSPICCVYGNCSCSSLGFALANLTSNVLINITTDVTLSSLIRVSDLENVSIIGHNNPTVNCRSVGGISFTFSHHLIIQDITWNGCGTENHTEPGLKLINSSNVMIQNCTFQNSIGQAVVLSELSGEVDIKDCNFISNYNYKGHGALIHYTSQATSKCSRHLFISNCNFTSNEGASLVYIEHRYSECNNNNNITFHCTNFYSNKGISIYVVNQRLCFYGNSLFQYNRANDSAGIYISDHSTVIFDNDADVKFVHNFAKYRGAAVFLKNHSSITFDQNSIVTFHDNTATNGTIYADTGSNVTFKGNCHVTFSNNSVTRLGAAIYSVSYSYIVFAGNSDVTFLNNVVTNTEISELGGIICSGDNSHIIFKESSVTLFSKNDAKFHGGVIMSYNHSLISFQGTSNTVFRGNNAYRNGGAIFLGYYSFISFKENSVSVFTNNTAAWGGAIFANQNSNILFDGNSTAKFSYNTALFGGGVIDSYDSSLQFKGNSNVTINNNSASSGGAICSHCEMQLCCRFGGNSTVTFSDNDASFGGAMYTEYSEISFDGHARIAFLRNKAANNGGSCDFSYLSIITLKEYVNVTFKNNNAFYTGGAIHLNTNSNITFEDNSTALFKSNQASDGGAIGTLMNSSITVQDYTRITFITNNALYGGAIFFDTTHTSLVFKDQDEDISFISNTARIAGDDMYFNSTESSGGCLNNRIIGINNKTKRFIATPPNKLQFCTPATCNDNNKTECDSYYLRHIMLGEEIIFPVCVFNYYNQPYRFLLYGEDNQNYVIRGSNQNLLSCNDTFSITGNNSLSKTSNYTINLFLHDSSFWKQISIKLTVELTPCHPGFWQYSRSNACECYNTEDIVHCSGSNSTIKRGYWFGSVTGKPTVTFCPINYCNFICCEASNGYYHLSPLRDNQCRSHRSGTACGSCTDGYTLSFDSPECVEVDSCTAGQTILVILLTVTYWIVMVTLVFAMMYYKVPIGYLYSITYYYSIADILLSRNLQEFTCRLYLTVSIMSSFSKITPQFLGQLCLITGMSGIDQQFIHYIHPTAVILILVIISLSARSSRRISAIISRGIIRVICLLLLLSYTSIASTSLLLLRSLSFHEIDKFYTYLSPDIEYFHGRHLAYGIVALLCTVTIVLGLPLLLILEPFLNHKINFVKIKPLLDQFQGCYKDRYRCFAGYYMICRLVIITIVILNLNDLLANYLLIVVCGVIALIHVTAKPYNNEIVNKFDGIILQLIIFNTGLPLLDDFDSQLATGIVFALMLLPLLTLTAITLFLHKDDIKMIAKHFTFKDRVSTNRNIDNIVIQNEEIPMKEFDLIVDDSVRNNSTTSVTVCDM